MKTEKQDTRSTDAPSSRRRFHTVYDEGGFFRSMHSGDDRTALEINTEADPRVILSAAQSRARMLDITLNALDTIPCGASNIDVSELVAMLGPTAAQACLLLEALQDRLNQDQQRSTAPEPGATA